MGEREKEGFLPLIGKALYRFRVLECITTGVHN